MSSETKAAQQKIPEQQTDVSYTEETMELVNNRSYREVRSVVSFISQIKWAL